MNIGVYVEYAHACNRVHENTSWSLTLRTETKYGDSSKTI